MTPRLAALKDDRGFTLAEMLVVCALLGTVIAGALSLVMVGQQSATPTANTVGAGFRAGANVEVHDAFVSNESIWNEANGYFEFPTQSSTLAIRNSTQDFNMALRAAYSQRIITWREI